MRVAKLGEAVFRMASDAFPLARRAKCALIIVLSPVHLCFNFYNYFAARGYLLGECGIPGGGCSPTEGPKGHRRGVQEPSGQWQAVEGDPVGSSSKSLLHWGTAAGCRLGGSLLGECGIPGGCL